MAMLFTGRHNDQDGVYDIVKCDNCGVERTEGKDVDPRKLKCSKCKGDNNATDVSSHD